MALGPPWPSTDHWLELGWRIFLHIQVIVGSQASDEHQPLALRLWKYVIFQLPGPVRVNAHQTLVNVFQPPCCCSMSFESSAEDARFIKHPLKDVCAVQLLPGYYNHPLGRLNSPAELCAPGPHVTGTLQSFTVTCCSAKSLLSCSCLYRNSLWFLLYLLLKVLLVFL